MNDDYDDGFATKGEPEDIDDLGNEGGGGEGEDSDEDDDEEDDM